MYKTHFCKEINESNKDNIVKISGWLRTIRNHGNILFLDIYDYDGSLQCVVEKNNTKLMKVIDECKIESVISLKGMIKLRDTENINNKISSGKIEMIVEEIEIINKSKDLPFALHQENLSEELQMQYRFLYLRKPEMQNILKTRSKVIDFLRNFMKKEDFLEIQTPLLANSSDEGARDYVVPSRLHPNKFYALPQAPQQFKQLLMASGVEKYFQVAPCFRDEDPRSDRLVGEFYQLDLEQAFATEQDILNLLENMLIGLFKTFCTNFKQNKFDSFTYLEAMEKFGSDKPDLRNPLYCIPLNIDQAPSMFKEKMQVNSKFKITTLSCYIENMSNSYYNKLLDLIKQNKGTGLAYCSLKNNEWTGPLSKMLSKDTIEYLTSNSFDKNCNVCFLIADERAYELIGILREFVGKNLIDENDYKFCFIKDFPMFEQKDGKYVFTHNPFSMPKNIKDMPEKIIASQYDVVCNGYEICSGAVRNHKLENIQEIFKIALEKELSIKELEEKFPVFKSFSYGIPPHAGAALGIDRIIMLIAKQKNVRDIVAFPLNQNGQNLLINSPSFIDDKLKKELNLK